MVCCSKSLPQSAGSSKIYVGFYKILALKQGPGCYQFFRRHHNAPGVVALLYFPEYLWPCCFWVQVVVLAGMIWSLWVKGMVSEDDDVLLSLVVVVAPWKELCWRKSRRCGMNECTKLVSFVFIVVLLLVFVWRKSIVHGFPVLSSSWMVLLPVFIYCGSSQLLLVLITLISFWAVGSTGSH